jgi:hypothetical protein
MWRSIARVTLISLLGLCFLGAVASNAQAARILVASALLPWLVFLVWRGIRGRHDLLWLTLLPLGIAAVLLILLASFVGTTPQLFPMRGLLLAGRVEPEVYTLRVACQPSRDTCSTTHELTLSSGSFALPGHTVEPGRRGLLVREVVAPAITTVRAPQLALGARLADASAPPSSSEAPELLAVAAKLVCVELTGLPPDAFLASRGSAAAPRSEPVDSASVRVSWCTDRVSGGLGFTYVQPPWQSLAWLVRPFARLTATHASGLAGLLSVGAILLRRRR